MPIGLASLGLSRNGLILHPQRLQLVLDHLHLVEVPPEDGDPIALDELVDLLMPVDLLHR